MGFKEVVAGLFAKKAAVIGIAAAVAIGGGTVAVKHFGDSNHAHKHHTVTAAGVSVKGENLKGCTIEIVKYGPETDAYTTAYNTLHGEYEEVRALEVMDIVLKDKDGNETEPVGEVDVELKITDETKKAVGEYTLWNKNWTGIQSAEFYGNAVKFSSDVLGRFVISKTEKFDASHLDDEDQTNTNQNADNKDNVSDNQNNNSNNNNNATDDKKDEVKKVSVAKAKISSVKDQTYTGKEIKPSVTVKYDGKTLANGTDYTLSYSNNTNVGTAKIIIAGKGNYEGSVTVTFKIVEAPKDEGDKGNTGNGGNAEVKEIDISKAKIAEISEQKYTGSAVKPSVTVTLDGKTLKKDTDYTVTYEDNVNVGVAFVLVKGKGNYTGETGAFFKIVKVEETKTVTLNKMTTHHGYSGYFTKNSNIMDVDRNKLGLSENDEISLYYTEYYDKDTGESLLFACGNVMESKFLSKVNAAGGFDAIGVKVK